MYIARRHIFWRRPFPHQIRRGSGKKAGISNGTIKYGVVLFNNGANGLGAELRDLVSIHLAQQHGANALGAVVTLHDTRSFGVVILDLVKK
jgi:hypothetical protein